MTKEVQAMMPLVELPSGVCVRPDLISFIARKDLGKFMCVFQQTGIAPEITTADLDVLKGIGVVQTPPQAEGTPSAANDTEGKIIT